MKTVALVSRLSLLLSGTCVGMFASVIVLIGLAGRSLTWLAAGAVIMLLSAWLIEQFDSRPDKHRSAAEDRERTR